MTPFSAKGWTRAFPKRKEKRKVLLQQEGKGIPTAGPRGKIRHLPDVVGRRKAACRSAWLEQDPKKKMPERWT